jgi:type II secretory pathway component PulC
MLAVYLGLLLVPIVGAILYLRPKSAPILPAREAAAKAPVAAEARSESDRGASSPEDSKCDRPLPDRSLVLGGTLVLTDPKQSVAIFHVGGGPGVAARAGERLRSRKYEVTHIGRRKACVLLGKTGARFLVTAPEVTTKSDLRLLSEWVGIHMRDETHLRVSAEILKRELSDLTTVLQSARAVPQIENGKFVGFLLDSIDPSSIFRALGLQPGDVLTGAGDVELRGPADGLLAYQQLLGKQLIEIRLKRGGRSIKLQYDTR